MALNIIPWITENNVKGVQQSEKFDEQLLTKNGDIDKITKKGNSSVEVLKIAYDYELKL